MIDAERVQERMDWFRERCKQAGLAYTHQRQVIYRVLAASDAHMSPESVYARVRAEVPSISLATIYKSIKTFVEEGILLEVNPLHEAVRLDANLEPHHHLVCTTCQSVEDLPVEMLEPVKPREPLPGGFRPRLFHVEVLGLCARCAAAQTLSGTT